MLISIGTFNLSTNIYGQNSTDTSTNDSSSVLEQFYLSIVERVISIIIPYVGGLIGILITYARSKGLQVSKDSEEYLIRATQSVVENQSRTLFKNVYKNKELLSAWATNTLDDEGNDQLKQALKQYKNDAKTSAVISLQNEINSSDFKKLAKDMIGDNLSALIDNAYEKNQSKKAERAKNLLLELSDLAVNSALLHYNKQSLSDQEKQEIIENGIKILAKNFDFESIILDVSNATMHLEAALSKKIQ